MVINKKGNTEPVDLELNQDFKHFDGRHFRPNITNKETYQKEFQ